MTKTWVVFLDMLGTKESAKITRSEYPTKIELFKSQIVNVAENLDCNISMRLFSDSVYFEIDSFKELVSFCRSTTLRLFSQDIYFKGAVAEGSLDESPIHIDKNTVSGKKINISGAAFGESVVSVHYGQERFKGIGYNFLKNSSGAFNATERSEIVQSIYPVANNRLSLEWEPYYDLRYTNKSVQNVDTEEVVGESKYVEGTRFVKGIVEAALRAERNKKDLSRYYLSVLHTLVESSNFSDVEYYEDRWRNVPVVFCVLFLNQHIRKGILQIKGGDTLFLHMAEKILNTQRQDGGRVIESDKNNAIASGIVNLLVRSRIVGKTYPKTPAFVFSEETRQFVAKTEVSLQIGQ